jgi:sugar O-acyltransferase (sialic acid O-acetyltransferase NeuD family)
MSAVHAGDPGRVVVFGAGGLGREIMQILRDIAAAGSPAECVAFAVDPGFAAGGPVHGIPVRQDLAAMLRSDPGLGVVVALGNPGARAETVARLRAEAGPRFATLRHPAACIGERVSLGEGSMIFGQVSMTTDITLGCHVLVNPGCTIAHDVVLEDYATLGPSVALAGGVHLEAGVEIGIGARVAPRIRIGRNAMLGAGTVVIRPVPSGATVVGVPGRELVRAPQ